jgi:hypothetical protein
MKPSFLLVLGALLFTVPAYAERIAIANFAGPGADVVRNQVTQALCEDADCVNANKVMKGAKPDWKKAKKERVAFIVTGKVVAKGKKRTLEVQVLSKPGAPKLKKSYPLDGNTLAKKTLASATTALTQAMGGGGKSKPEPVAEATPEREEPKPSREEPAPAVDTGRNSEPVAAHETEPPPPPVRAAEPEVPAVVDEPAPSKKKGKHPIISIQVGVDGFNRSLTYAQVTTPNLRTYSASLAFAPGAAVELFPLAAVTQGALAGLGIDASYAMVVGLSSRRLVPAEGCMPAPCPAAVTYPTSSSKLDVAVKFRIRLGDSFGLAPHVGFRTHSFGIGKGSDGSTIDGLPSTAYSAIKAGLGLDASLGELLVVFAHFSYLQVLSSGQIISAAYFNSGSAMGLEGGAGVGVKLPFLTALQVRAAFNFTRYGLSFRPVAADIYQATGATDQYMGANVGLRYTY